jgi:hypothetical protein
VVRRVLAKDIVNKRRRTNERRRRDGRRRMVMLLRCTRPAIDGWLSGEILRA